MSLADWPLRSEYWASSYALGHTPDGAIYLREQGSIFVIVIKRSEAFDLAVQLHKRSGRNVPLDAMGNPLDSRRAELAMLAASASGTTGMTMVRVTACPRPQIAPSPVGPCRKSIDGEVRGLRPDYSALA